MNIGTKIKEIREKKGITIELMAIDINIDRQKLVDIENNVIVPSDEELNKIYSYLKINKNDLFMEVEDGYFANSRTRLTKEIFDSYANMTFIKQIKKSYGFIILIVLFMILTIFFKDLLGLLIPWVILLGVFVFVIIANKKILKKQRTKLSDITNESYNEFYFYDEYLRLFASDKENNVNLKVLYKNIKKVFYSEDFIFVQLDNNIYAIEKKTINGDMDKIENIFKKNVKKNIYEKNNPNLNSKIKNMLLAFFIVSLLAPLLSITTTLILGFSSNYPNRYFMLLSSLRVNFIFLLIPVTSFILGIIYLRKDYKTKKNIISSSIVIPFMLVFGIVGFSFSVNVSHDYNKLNQLSSIINENFPKEGKLTYINYQDEVNIGTSVSFLETYEVYYTNETEIDVFKNKLENDPTYQISIDELYEDGLIDYSVYFSHIGENYYKVFNKTTNEVNTKLSTYGEFDMYFISYEVENNYQYILHYSITNNV